MHTPLLNVAAAGDRTSSFLEEEAAARFGLRPGSTEADYSDEPLLEAGPATAAAGGGAAAAAGGGGGCGGGNTNAAGHEQGDEDEDDEEEVAVGVVTASLQRKRGVCGGVIDDMQRRCPLYGADLRNGLHWKTISSALFMFFATFMSTVALGVKIQVDLKNRLGVSEYLMMNSIAGMVHALLGCQPMLILRPTGPITLILTLLGKLADGVFQVDYFQLLAWTGFFVAFFMTIVAAFEISRFIARLTRFTHEIFAFFVCSIYIEDGVSSVINRFLDADDTQFATSLFQACLAAGTFTIAIWFHGARTWACFGSCFRSFLADYAVTLAVVAVSALSFAFPQLPNLVQYVDVPRTFGPTCHFEPDPNITRFYTSYSTNSSSTSEPPSGLPQYTPLCSKDIDNSTYPARPWMPELWNSATPDLLPLYAAGCALLIIFFFYFDQNISSLYTQLPSKQLKHGSYYHSSFQWMGIFNAIGPLCGLPFVTGSLPHSPQFIHAVTVYAEEVPDVDTRTLQSRGSKPKHSEHKSLSISAVYENRVAPFVMYAMIGAALFVPSVIELIPFGAVDGILTFVGVAGLLECQLWERILLLLRAPSEFPAYDKHKTPYVGGVRPLKMHAYTCIQLLLLAGCWAVNLSPAGLAFSLVVLSLVPFRTYVIPCCFTKRERIALDSPEKETDISW